MKETELAKGVIDWLQDMKWDVYQEVQVFSYGPIADIVGLFNGMTWVIETKVSLGLKVMQQAQNWRPFSNLVSVASRMGGNSGNGFVQHLLKMLGIGLIVVSIGDVYVETDVEERIRPAINRRPGKHLRDSLKEVHKTFAEAGNAEKLRWSPFQQTCQDVRRFVEENPGATLKEIVGSVKTHYHSVQTARICIAKYAEEGVLKGVRKVIDGKVCRFYPEEVAINCNQRG